MERPPPSDAQLAQLLELQRARRRRAIAIFAAVGAVVALVLGGSSLYFSAQAKKKRNLAFSRVTKCLLGTPLADGEPPMSRFRAAWRARLLDAKPAGEEEKAKAWPNRCVADIVAFTDTLKELGEVTETEKDLGYYSRALAKETAGDNWQNVDTYRTALEEFEAAAAKGKFDFVDLPDVTAPALVEAKGVEELEAGGALVEDTASIGREQSSLGIARFYVPAAKGRPERLCQSRTGETLECVRPAPGGLPPEASGVPWILGGDDDAPALLAFGRHGGIGEGTSVSTGVFRTGDGLRVVPGDEYYVAGGWSRAASLAVLLKPQAEPLGSKFKVGRLSAASAQGKLETADVALDDWSGEPSAIAVAGDDAVWVTSSDELRRRAIVPSPGPSTLVGKLPGRGTRARACRVGDDYAVVVTTSADGLPRQAVAFLPKTGEAKMFVVEEGFAVSCGKSRVLVLGRAAYASCTPAGCEPKPLDDEGFAHRVVLEGSVADARLDSGLLRVVWRKDGKDAQIALYDGQTKGRDVLPKSRFTAIRTVPGRDMALLAIAVDEKLYFARIGEAGLSPVKVVE